MSEWASYQLQDFVPFTADVYLRLLERMGETFWPLHIATLGVGAAALLLALTHRGRVACALVAPLWFFVGLAFFAERYSELNWAGHYIGRAFIAEAMLLLLVAITSVGIERSASYKGPPAIAGILLTACGLVVYPLIAPITGASWMQAQTFGIHADPTAAATLGLILLTLRGAAMWIAAVIPALWLTISGLTLQVLELPWASALFITVAVALAGLVWKSTVERRRYRSP